MLEHKFYSIRNLVPANGYQAVWAFQPVDNLISVERWPLAFIGVADLQERQDAELYDSDSEIVGVELINGSFMVVNGCPCFYGIVRADATQDECIDLLPDDLRSRLSKAKVTNRTDVSVSYVLGDDGSTRDMDPSDEVLYGQLCYEKSEELYSGFDATAQQELAPGLSTYMRTSR